MDHLELGQEVLDTILGYLGFAATVEVDRNANLVNVATTDAKLLIGHRGDRLEEIEYLVNRIVQDRQPDAKRFRIDIDLYRATQEHRMIEEAEAAAARAVAAGKPVKLEPMNSYQRHIIHDHFKGHSEVRTWSPRDSARLKRISLIPLLEGESADT